MRAEFRLRVGFNDPRKDCVPRGDVPYGIIPVICIAHDPWNWWGGFNMGDISR